MIEIIIVIIIILFLIFFLLYKLKKRKNKNWFLFKRTTGKDNDLEESYYAIHKKTGEKRPVFLK